MSDAVPKEENKHTDPNHDESNDKKQHRNKDG